MASRKAVTTIEKEVKEKQPKKSAKKVVDSLDSNVETYEQINMFEEVEDIKKNKTASKPKKVNKKPDELDVSPNNVLDINDDVSEEVLPVEETFIDKVVHEPIKTNEKPKKKTKVSKYKGNIANNRILISRGLSSKMVEERVKKGLVNKT